MSGLEHLLPLPRYARASERAAEQIIAAYSSSFGLATRLLGPRHRVHVRNIYALVRVADELVDGAAEGAGLSNAQQHELLDQLERETERATQWGYSSNPVVQAFCGTARAAGIDGELTGPFFASMRMDLEENAAAPSGASLGSGIPLGADAPAPLGGFAESGPEHHARYVYGSAEVVGLMCLRVFMKDEAPSEREAAVLEHGARRLGAAFQNVNFLRDLGDDRERLGRDYLSAGTRMDAAAQARWVATVREQLADAAATLPLLPRDARVAVGCALRLFSELTDRIADTPAELLPRRRVRVGAPRKALLALQSVLEPNGPASKEVAT
ncbi:phytoene/squalene synthase family protein [Leucobacter triazinivorans]|uniref:Phytoene synthase n=1 Tax=Leucobacter triazinivorans TaxID=1784719 RepID=A0A4P6KGT1_9MICO|nr:squalene/phytoene synthase family protein [Leucobacter triazinivorans]QBE48714.1 phytoene synthase [Leucobacter triazinivorans]